MILTIRNAINKNAWLFLAAAWLYTLSFIFTNYLSYSSSATKVASILSDYIQGEERSFNNIVNDTSQVAVIVNDSLSQLKQELVTDAQGIFAYSIDKYGNTKEIFWNTNKMSVDPQDILKQDSSYIVNYQNGIFELIKKKVAYKNINYIFCTLVPVRWQYFMQNEYLEKSFAVHAEIGNSYELTASNTGSPVKNSKGQILFGIREKEESNTDLPGRFSLFLRITALIFLFVFVSNIASEIVRNKNFITGFAFLTLFFILLRIIVYMYPFPFDYRPLKLFSSSIYYDDFVNDSLGNLLLNAILLLWLIIFFRRFYRVNSFQSTKFDKAITVFRYSVFMLIPLLTFYTSDIVSSLVTKSSISFNAADFFSLNLFSLAGFVIICILLYAWLYLTGILFQLSLTLPLPFFWRTISFLSCCFLLISLRLFSLQPEILLSISVFLLFVLLLIEARNNPSFSSLVSSSFFIMWALVVTASASALLIYQNNTTEKVTRIKLAEAMQSDEDSSGTYLLRIALSDFNDDFFENNFQRFQSPESNKLIKDSLSNQLTELSANKYITQIYLYDDNNNGLYNSDSTKYDVINSVVENKSASTGFQDLYYYKNDKGSFNYIYRKQIYDYDYYLGCMFVVIRPRLFKNDVLVPELFRQVNSVSMQLNRGYVTGVYENRKLISAFTGFNFADTVKENQLPEIKYYYTDSLGYNQLWYKVNNDKLIIIAKKNNWLFNFITLFAYLFVLFIILAFIVHESRRVLEEPVQKFTIRSLFRFNIRTQIQTTIIGVSILSFLIVGISTISFFIYRFNKSTTVQLINSSQVIANEIRQVLSNDSISFNKQFNYTDENNFAKKIIDISTLHNTDINFYKRDGTLLVSSQPYIYSKEILSTNINPRAFYEMHYNHSTRFVHTETIGNFSYQSIYIPVKDVNDETIAYLNIPSLSSHNELQEEISDFLVIVIILNALIFIFAGAIAVALTGRITSSLELISSKMKEVNIGSTNEEIIWKRNDEIGLLVDEYNKMVKQLEQSAAALVRSEREGAWQQMAKQVAHEIKNPLTPMKLSIQYLQRSMENNTADAVELSKKLAASLIEQIDQLAKIATDFSQFANIENVLPESLNLNEIIQSLVNIYETDAALKIEFMFTNNATMICCDKAQMNRLFTNLIKNALEASFNRKKMNVQIRLFTENKNAIISIHDNGYGIKDTLQQKIFDPNFTTKTSGTGLGLAMCKAIVEKANGKIWFITAPEEGTTFFVQLPLADEVPL